MAIKLVVIDVDGVMCDGKYYDRHGKCYAKQFSDLDFTAIKRLQAAGIDVVFLSGDMFNQGMARQRHVPFYFSRVDGAVIDKGQMMRKILSDYDVTVDEVATIGDDIFDIPMFEFCAISFCPVNAPREVREVVDHVLGHRSGQDVVSEMYDCLLKWQTVPAATFQQLTELDAKQNG